MVPRVWVVGVLRVLLPVLLVTLLLGTWPLIGQEAAAPTPFVITGDAAARYEAPSDTEVVQRRLLPSRGLVSERRQQYYREIPILGAQITIIRDGDGGIVRVIGRHFPDMSPVNAWAIEPNEVRAIVAQDIAARDIGSPMEPPSMVQYLHPETRRYFWRVTTPTDGDGGSSVWEHWIDAQSGETVELFDALPRQTCASATGKGRAYDRDPGLYTDDIKDLTCLVEESHASAGELRLATRDTSQFTADCVRDAFVAATHPDSTWYVSGRLSPGTGAVIDAHYYIALAESYFRTQHDFSLPVEVRVGAHAQGEGRDCGVGPGNYRGAFWHPTFQFFGFGDGDGVMHDSYASLDMAVHEFAHSVTHFTTGLVYHGESGALNESFSDIMAAVVERLVDRGSLPARVFPREEPDADLRRPGSEWRIGEDFDLTGDGIRNMAEPAAYSQAAHYDEIEYGPGWVHFNSGIANHAFYRLVEKYGVDVARAAEIFVDGFGGLVQTAKFCDARQATMAVAWSEEVSVVDEAWSDVGLDARLCGER